MAENLDEFKIMIDNKLKNQYFNLNRKIAEEIDDSISRIRKDVTVNNTERAKELTFKEYLRFVKKKEKILNFKKK